MAFLEMTFLKINIYTSLDQKVPHFQIDHLHSNDEIKFLLINWKHYERLSQNE